MDNHHIIQEDPSYTRNTTYDNEKEGNTLRYFMCSVIEKILNNLFLLQEQLTHSCGHQQSSSVSPS